MSEAEIWSFHPFSFTMEANLLSGVAKSGVCGPLLPELDEVVSSLRETLGGSMHWW